MLRTALVALLVGAVLSGCGIRIMKYEFSDDHVVAAGAYTSVRARPDSGDVSIRFQQGLTETRIRRTIEHRKDRKPDGPTHRVEGTALVLDGCGDNCEVNYEVLVPSADITLLGDAGSGDLTAEGLASVEYKTGSGRAIVRDIAGDVRIVTSSGDFEATRVKGSVTADLHSGRMRLHALQGKVVVKTSSGDVTGTAIDSDMTVDTVSGRVELMFTSARSARVDTGSGDIIVRVPEGPYKVTGDSDRGDRKIDVSTSPDAQYELKLSARSGNVRVLPV